MRKNECRKEKAETSLVFLFKIAKLQVIRTAAKWITGAAKVVTWLLSLPLDFACPKAAKGDRVTARHSKGGKYEPVAKSLNFELVVVMMPPRSYVNTMLPRSYVNHPARECKQNFRL